MFINVPFSCYPKVHFNQNATFFDNQMQPKYVTMSKMICNQALSFSLVPKALC